MGFWGKAIGIGFGFMVGGPLGAIIGGLLGHSFDVSADEFTGKRLFNACPGCGSQAQPTADGKCPDCGYNYGYARPQQAYDRQFLFYVSLTSLAAKMAKADGVVTEDEVRAFDRFVVQELRVPVSERKVIAGLFNKAKNSPDSAVDIARQFRQLIGFQPEVLQTMIQLLFRISMADGKFHPAEDRFIRQVANAFGMSSAQYDQIKALFVKSNDKAYQILGISSDASDAEIKSAYKKLVMEYHPDRLMAKGVPEDFIKIANEKMAAINSAYDQIQKERGF
ncbi:MAG: TerB family tellurite resistance protein [Calditrichaceae bacterium]|nr:TerB family tellurite resistance protein [Calditrichaceae bacterium]MBN2709338.1 TerB family tellurite resistance protein [Calditrichaceae bacterium]RQV94670.1 MAG: molecular chaperone DjiA [Calditrichota bacterium]